MSAPHALVEWVDGLLRQFGPASSQLKSWIALEDKPTKIADMMWWYYAIHPEENERTGIIFGQRVRALVETVFWLQASIPYRGFRKTLDTVGVVSFTAAIQSGKWGHWDVPDNMIEAHQAASKNFVKKWLESFHEETGLTAYSLLKPTIARRVALMHGTTKARWERDARSF
ncbi:hypothetical protein JCM10021v2_005668 [Rhodotorula toruloides]|uniref:Uncharacterized protein n=1 Tax=Rhodotorula toruloides TaxID=5286 RepID=A0A2T0A821_RHOTO|nr:hypothetical protein AAT19DRAFT_14506 [Rhodotorula toruloides]